MPRKKELKVSETNEEDMSKKKLFSKTICFYLVTLIFPCLYFIEASVLVALASKGVLIFSVWGTINIIKFAKRDPLEEWPRALLLMHNLLLGGCIFFFVYGLYLTDWRGDWGLIPTVLGIEVLGFIIAPIIAISVYKECKKGKERAWSMIALNIGLSTLVLSLV